MPLFSLIKFFTYVGELDQEEHLLFVHLQLLF